MAAGKEVEHVVRKAADWVAAVKAGFVSTLQLLARAELSRGSKLFTQLMPIRPSPSHTT